MLLISDNWLIGTKNDDTAYHSILSSRGSVLFRVDYGALPTHTSLGDEVDISESMTFSTFVIVNF